MINCSWTQILNRVYYHHHSTHHMCLYSLPQLTYSLNNNALNIRPVPAPPDLVRLKPVRAFRHICNVNDELSIDVHLKVHNQEILQTTDYWKVEIRQYRWRDKVTFTCLLVDDSLEMLNTLDHKKESICVIKFDQCFPDIAKGKVSP